MQANANTQGWHMAQWGTWGWAETILKLVSIAAGVVAFFCMTGDLVVGGALAHVILLLLVLLLTLGSVFQLWIRWQQHETISFVFAVLNLLGHLGLLLALAHDPSPRTLPIIFGLFYLLGQLVKIQFLRVTGYTEGGANTVAMVRVTGVMAVLYALVAILVLV